jgi:hypothetical protein
LTPKTNFSQVTLDPLTIVNIPLVAVTVPHVIVPEQVNEFEFGVAVTKESAADVPVAGAVPFVLPPESEIEAQATFVFAGIVTVLLAVFIITMSPATGYVPELVALALETVDHVAFAFHAPFALA